MKYCKLKFFVKLFIILFQIGRVKGIIGGNYADVGQFKYQVSIQMNNDHHCGGVIISEKHVISAGHCFLQTDNSFRNKQFSVIAGTINLKARGIRRIEIQKVFIPKELSIIESNLDDDEYTEIGDIAVVKLNEELTLGENSLINKVNLPIASEPPSLYVGEKATVSGFGAYIYMYRRNKFGKRLVEICTDASDALKYASSMVIPNEECTNLYSERLHDNHLCASMEQRDVNSFEGVCLGDSGGPLVLHGNLLIGIVNYSDEDCNEKKSPGIYTRITSYLPFIQKSMNDETSLDIRVAEYNNRGLVQSI